MKARFAIVICFALSLTFTAHAKHRQSAASASPAGSAALISYPSAKLSKFLDAHLDQILAPLDAAGFKKPQLIVDLRESFADGMAQAPETAKPVFQAALQICDALSAAADEREKAVASMKASANVQGDSTLDATAKDHAGWLQQQREIREQKQRNKDAAQTNAFFTASQKSEWTTRAAQLHAGIENMYEQERVMERQFSAATPAPVPSVASKTGT